MNIAVITGASSGMGMEFAGQIDNNLCKTDEIWLLARRREPMEKLSRSMKTKTRCICIDISDERELKRFAEVLAISVPKITMLVNCAGVGIHGAFSEQRDDDISAMLRLNVMTLTCLTKICLPYMRKGSKIIQFASGAAFVPQARFAVYAATKSYVYSFGMALRKELKKRGIGVTMVCPGPVDTPFLEKAYGDISRMNILKKLTMVSADRVVSKAIEDCKRGRAVSVCGLPMKVLYLATQSVQRIVS